MKVDYIIALTFDGTLFSREFFNNIFIVANLYFKLLIPTHDIIKDVF